MKSSDNGEQCEEKESNRQIARFFLIISSSSCRPVPRVYQTIWGITLLPPRSLSSRCLSFSAHPPFCTYVSLSIVVLSLTMFFLVRKHTLLPRESAPRRENNRKSCHDIDAWRNLLTSFLIFYKSL